MKKFTLIKSKYFSFLGCLIIISVYSLLILFFILKEKNRPNGDEARKLIIAMDFYRVLNGDSAFNVEGFHSPLYFYLPSYVCFLLGEFSYKVCVAFNIFYYSLTCLFMSLLVKIITGKKWDVVLSIFLFSTMNFTVFYYGRLFCMEFGLSAVICMSILLLVKTDYFGNRVYSLLFGISLAIGMLMKWSYIIYIIGPFFMYAIYTFRITSRKYGGMRFRNLLYSVLLGFGSFLIYAILFLDFNGLIERYLNTLRYESDISNPLGHIVLFFNYCAIVTTLRGFLAALPIFSTVPIMLSFYFYVRKAKKNFKYLLLSWFLAPLIILSIIIRNSENRYALPVLPCLAIIVTIGAGYISRIRKECVISSVVLIILLVFLVNVSYLYNNTRNSNDSLEKVLLEINDADFQDAIGEEIFLAVDFAEEDIIDKLRYIINFHNLEITLLDSRGNIRDGMLIENYSEDIRDITQKSNYLITDYPSFDASLIVKQGVFNGKRVWAYKQFIHGYDNDDLRIVRVYRMENY